ncbi:VWFA and cache domain-containing protein CG16868 [Lutzomyia longipalpis]|uniref:VWFA and cache domain-containing protein CG16868 n=1 Tax=Lutzomyia longipalpis TaxID=7200 RepID=UPI00248400AB|nr:VWFA and cache domain-containing protein CG16868 [Lutzomyia longipalpis]XP_055689668.1 VWFA and cache domain-containing protein CG16868 [Lutzomyia longipalpis]
MLTPSWLYFCTALLATCAAGSHYVPVILNGSATVSVRRLTEPAPVTAEEPPRAQRLARRLEERFKEIRDDELGVPDVQKMFDLMEFVPLPRDDVETVKRMSQKLAMKLEKAHLVISNLRDFIVSTAQQLNRTQLNSVTFPCPFRNSPTATSVLYERQQSDIVDFMKTLEDVKDNEEHFEMSLMKELKKFSHSSAHFRRQYFMAAADNAVDRTCPDNQHLRQLFTAAIRDKRILLLVDHGSSLNMDQLELTKATAKSVVSLLHATDSIAVLSISDRVGVFEPEQRQHCSGQMYAGTMDNRGKIAKFLEGLNKTKAQTNHTLGFEQAFKLLAEIERSEGISGQFMFLYISRGLLSSLADATGVLEVIAAGQKALKHPVVINTIQVVLDEKRIMYETQFLCDITLQDYRKHKIEGAEPAEAGLMLTVNKYRMDEVFVNVTAFFSQMFREGNLTENITLHSPYLDPDTKDILVSLTQTCERFGVFGVDLYLNDLAEDVLYYNKYPDSYAIILDKDGNVVSHPFFADRTSAVEMIFPTDIGHIEPPPFTPALREEILSEIFGSHAFRDAASNDTVTYTWHHVMDSYVVCIVTRTGALNRSPVSLRRVYPGIHYYYQHNNEVSFAAIPEIVYHRLDLIPPPGGKTMCRHFKQIGTMDCGTLFLSPGAFQSPFLFVRNSRESSTKATIHTIQSLMAYIRDKTNLLANPGLLPAVRNDVAALTHIIGYLKKQHLREGPLKNFIIRRYVASVNGVLLLYPGTQVSNQLEVTQRPWFGRAMAYPGRIVVTEPYLDAGGAGYVTTIAHTIFEARPNALHSAQRDTPIGVVALDLTMGFHYKLVLESGGFCSEANVKCFLMEDRGYLIAHPSVLEPVTGINSRRPLEHITHRESFVANDILNHKELVQKKLCNVYANRTIQRYYQFNISLTDVLTNVVHGERTKYQITVIPGTNIFVGVLNASNDGGAFCPCSTVDRLCLNCNRMEQTECECPCECPLHYEPPGGTTEAAKCAATSVADGEDQKLATDGVCMPFMPEAASPATALTYSVDDLELRACVSAVCDLYATQTECLGVVGCEWCQVDVDGETIFTQPFCTSMQSCFNGILGSATPYGDGQLGSAIVDPLIPPAYSAIGPVAGATIALCLVVGFAMYCYRQNQDPGGAEHLYGADSQGENQLDVPMARLNFDDMGGHDDCDFGNSSNQNLLPATGIMIPEVSPYRAPSACRRPNAADSDHGYSTMTPHEDSENLCFTLADPLLTHKRLSMSDSASISTSVSSPTNCRPLGGFDRHLAAAPVEGTTILPASPHLVLAPVTVHRQLEATTS